MKKNYLKSGSIFIIFIFCLVSFGCQSGKSERKDLNDISQISDQTESQITIYQPEGGLTVGQHMNNIESNFDEIYPLVDTTDPGFTGMDASVITSGEIPDNRISDTITVGASGSVNDAAIPAGIARDSELHDAVTIGTGNGLSISTQALSLALGTNTDPGAISSSWVTFLESIDTESELKELYNLEIGTDVQAQNDLLTDVSGLTPVEHNLLGFDGSNNVVAISSIDDSIIPSAITRDSELPDLASPGTIGGTTPGIGNFTTLNATTISSTGTDGNRVIVATANTDRTPGSDTYEQYVDTAAGGWVYVNGDGVEHLIGSGSNLDTTNFAASALVDASEALTQETTDLMIPTWGAILAKLNDVFVTGNPSIAITTPAADETWVDSLTYTSFAGTAFDLQGISAIEWKLESGGTYADTGVTGTTNWSVSSITLSEGANELYARVTDTSTNTDEAHLTLNADSIDPINADGGTDATHDGTTNITLDVDVTEANISTVTYNSTELSLTDIAMTPSGTAPDYTYTASVDPDSSVNTIDLVVTSTDLAGNTDTDTYNVTYSGGASIPTYSSGAILAVGNVIEMTFSEAVTQGSGWTESLFTVDGSVTGSDIGMTVTSGDGTTQLTALLDSVIQSGETATLDYAGATDGLESSTGGDLVAFSGSAVTNNSTQSGTTDYYVGAPNTAGTPTGSYTTAFSSINDDLIATREYTATADGEIIGLNLFVQDSSYEQAWVTVRINGTIAGYVEITGASNQAWTGELSFASPVSYSIGDVIRFGGDVDNDATNASLGVDNTDSGSIYRSTTETVETTPPSTPTLTLSGLTGLMAIMHIQE